MSGERMVDHLQKRVTDHLDMLLEKVLMLEEKSQTVNQKSIPSSSITSDSIREEFQQIKAKLAELQAGFPSSNSVPLSSTGSQSELHVVFSHVKTLSQKVETCAKLLTILHREHDQMQQVLLKSEEKVTSDDQVITMLQSKVQTLERLVARKDTVIRDLQQSIEVLERTSYDGSLVWKITDFAQKRQEAITGQVPSLYSLYFFTSRSGYKIRGRVYLNGDGMGNNSHMSLFFVLMKGPFDALLAWPFRRKITLALLDQTGQGDDIVDSFRPDPNSSSFRRPVTEMNVASGCPMFMPLKRLESELNRYVKDDTMFIKISVEASEPTVKTERL